MKDLKQLAKAASNFRTAIDDLREINERGLSITLLYNFPFSCCDYASELLQKYLLEYYSQNTYRVWYYRENGSNKQSHCWLEIPGSKVIIDITGDQYPDYSVKTFVDDHPDVFHNEFRYLQKDTESYRDNFEKIKFDRDYKLIVNWIHKKLL